MTFGAGIPKRATNKDLAYAYLNDMLDPKVQGQFCVDSYYAPTIDNAEISDEIRQKIDIPVEHRDKVNVMDNGYLGANTSRLLEWWNKEFKSA